MVIKILQYISSASLIMAALYAGNSIQHYFELGIPGSIIGMLLLFSSMALGIIPPQWVKPAAQLFIRYMVLLFIPVSVGLMQHFEVLRENALSILTSTIGGTAIVLVCLSLILEKLLGKDK